MKISLKLFCRRIKKDEDLKINKTKTHIEKDSLKIAGRCGEGSGLGQVGKGTGGMRLGEGGERQYYEDNRGFSRMTRNLAQWKLSGTYEGDPQLRQPAQGDVKLNWPLP